MIAATVSALSAAVALFVALIFSWDVQEALRPSIVVVLIVFPVLLAIL